MVAAADSEEDIWRCSRCGWTYPNAHPSARHRRKHKQQCGKIKGFEHVTESQARQAGSSDDVSSGDDDARSSSQQELSRDLQGVKADLQVVNDEQPPPQVVKDEQQVVKDEEPRDLLVVKDEQPQQRDFLQVVNDEETHVVKDDQPQDLPVEVVKDEQQQDLQLLKDEQQVVNIKDDQQLKDSQLVKDEQVNEPRQEIFHPDDVITEPADVRTESDMVPAGVEDKQEAGITHEAEQAETPLEIASDVSKLETRLAEVAHFEEKFEFETRPAEVAQFEEKFEFETRPAEVAQFEENVEFETRPADVSQIATEVGKANTEEVPKISETTSEELSFGSELDTIRQVEGSTPVGTNIEDRGGGIPITQQDNHISNTSTQNQPELWEQLLEAEVVGARKSTAVAADFLDVSQTQIENEISLPQDIHVIPSLSDPHSTDEANGTNPFLLASEATARQENETTETSQPWNAFPDGIDNPFIGGEGFRASHVDEDDIKPHVPLHALFEKDVKREGPDDMSPLVKLQQEEDVELKPTRTKKWSWLLCCGPPAVK